MHEFQSYQDIQAELDDVIQKSYHPEFFVDKLSDGELYFNPVENCGLYSRFDHEYGVPMHTWFLNVDNLLFYVKDYSINPDQIYKNIKNLYIKNIVEIPRVFYWFENHEI